MKSMPIVTSTSLRTSLNSETSSRVHRSGVRHIKTTLRENLYKRLLDHVDEGVAAFDPDENTIYVNPAFVRLTGYSSYECINKMKCFDFIDEETKPIMVRESARRKKNIASQYEVTVQAKSGEKIPVLVSGAPTGDGGSIGILTDIRELKKREAHERQLAAILENSIDAIVGLDLNRKVTVWNRGAEFLFGYKENEILGKNVDVIVPLQLLEEGEIHRLRAETDTRGFTRNFKTVRVAKDGRRFPVTISQVAIRNEKGAISGYSALYRDISDQKRWEEELQDRFEKMQSAYMEMGRQRRYLDYLRELLDMVTGEQIHSDIYTYVVNAFLMISQVDAVTLRKWDSKKQQFMLMSASGIGQDWWGKKFVGLEGTVHGKAVELRKPMKIFDIWSDALYPGPGLARKYQLKSLLLIPMFFKHEIIGTVGLYLRPDRALDLLDNEFIPIFAKEIALAMKLDTV